MQVLLATVSNNGARSSQPTIRYSPANITSTTCGINRGCLDFLLWCSLCHKQICGCIFCVFGGMTCCASFIVSSMISPQIQACIEYNIVCRVGRHILWSLFQNLVIRWENAGFVLGRDFKGTLSKGLVSGGKEELPHASWNLRSLLPHR